MKKGFTSIELAIVLAILTIIGAIIVPSILRVHESSALLQDPYHQEQVRAERMADTRTLYQGWCKLHPETMLSHTEWMELKDAGMLTK